MHLIENIAALLRERFAKYSPILKIPQVAEILNEDVPTVRARIRRGSFPITVRQEEGGHQYVLLSDLVLFSVTGKRQLQLENRPARMVRNQQGINGKRKRGAPKKAERVARELAGGG